MPQKQRMLRHKETGELFVWTPHYAKMIELEEIPENIIADVVGELGTAEEPIPPQPPTPVPVDPLDTVISTSEIPVPTIKKVKKTHTKKQVSE